MGVSTTTCVIEYALDGVTALYSVPYVFFDADHLVLTYGTEGTENSLTRGADYTVAARPDSLPATGSITLLDPASLTGVLRIIRVTPQVQSLAQTQTGAQDAAAQVRSWDRLTLITQELTQAITDAEFVQGTLGGGYVTLATDQTITGQKTFSVTGSNKGPVFDARAADRHMAVFYRYNVTGSPLANQWQTGTIINSQGAYHSNSWMILSGNMEASPDVEGYQLPKAPVDDGSFMLGIWSDIYGPAIITRTAVTSTYGWNYQAMDHDGNYVFSVEDGPEIKFGAGNRAAMDTRIYRTGAQALRTNAALTIDGGPSGGGLTISDDGVTCLVTSAGSPEVLSFTDWSLINLGTVALYQTPTGGGIYTFAVHDATMITTEGGTTGLRVADAGDKLGFFAATPIVKPTSTTYADLAADLATLGLITNSITPPTLTGPVGSSLADTSIANALATLGLVTNSLTGVLAAVGYSPSMDFNAGQSTGFIITATDNVGFALNAPTNPGTGERITFTIRNTSGGALGTATWNSVFKMATWTQPANGYSQSIVFQYNGTNWVEVSRTPSDVPN